MTRHTGFDDTIAALATAPGAAALAVLRVSGTDAVAVADRVFEGAKTLASSRGFRATVGRVRDREGVADEVVAWVYRAPHTYTGEDLVEFSTHGGAVSAARVLEALWSAGARPASPGEFTRRAFLNGRMDLAQAEAVAELIEARGRRAQSQALIHLEGGLSKRVDALAEPLRSVLARLTVFLDFDEDVPEPPDVPVLAGRLKDAAAGLTRLAASHAPSRILRRGLTVAIAGRPNVGKSSLLNLLAGFDRAIVHHAPGTTRDVVDVTIELDGVPVCVIDTAGLREGDDPVEREGIERTRREIEKADVVLWVVDGSVEPTVEDRAIGRELQDKQCLVAINKEDLGHDDLGWVNDYSPWGVAALSCRTGSGATEVEALFRARLKEETAGAPDTEDLWITRDRHAHALEEAGENVDRARSVLDSGQPAELAAADLHRALAALGRITGDEAGDDLLDTIFSSFCIGK